MTPRALCIVRIAPLLVAFAPTVARGLAPQLRVWPATAPPCNGTLQACVDAASPGDTVEIRSDGPIAESIGFAKALTLRAGAGFHPDFAGSASIHASTSASGDQLIRLEGLTLEQGNLELTQGGSGAATFEVVGNAFDGDGIEILSTGSGPVSFFISGNTLALGQSPLYPGINVILSVSSSGSVIGNTLSGGAAIDVENGGPTMSAGLIANRVDAGSIRLLQGSTDTGTLDGRMLDNLVTNSSGYGMIAECDSGAFDVAIANNTTADDTNGITLDCSCAAGLTAIVSNNAMTGNSEYGYSVATSCNSVSDHHNLFFDNGNDIQFGNLPGPDSVFANPSYFPDHTLSPESPAIDAGDLGSVPADPPADAGGRLRVAGRTVDIGAFEAAAPDVLTWPGPSCTDTLQACVDTAADGDAVEIAKADPIAESISFSKPLTLRPAAGFHPHFSGTQTIQASYDGPGGGFIDIEGLTLDSGSIQVFQQSADPLFARVVGNVLLSASPTAIDVEPNGGGGPVTFEISGNAMSVSPDMLGNGSAVRIGPIADASGAIANNSIEMQSGASAGGIFYFGGDSRGIDVVSNHIAGAGYSYGVAIFPQTDASVTIRIANNLVTGQSSQTDESPGAIVLQETGGPLVATVINNTVTGDDDGIRALGTAGTISGLVANNIASRDAKTGIQIDAPLATSLQNRNNLVFANASDPFVHGPNTLTTDPLFAGTTDYHLKPSSPAIDAGAGVAVPPDLRSDLDGQPRIAGLRVDLGAYEVPEAPTSLTGAAAALAIGGLAWRRRIGPPISAPTPRDRG